jgi:phytoene synthase
MAETRFRASRELARRHGKTYYLATALLPPRSRPGIWAVYGFCRLADDIVDGASSLEEKQARLDELEHALGVALAKGTSPDPVLDALVATYRTWRIESETLARFLGAMRTDLTITRYATYEDLLAYMEGSAAVIGEMVLPILEGDPAAREPARALGLAFQLTNFIRDVGEDLDRGRIYLPLEDVEGHGALEDLLARRLTPRVKALVRFEIERTRDLYRASLAGDALLPPASRRCVRLARELYGQILDYVERNDYDVLTRRAIVPPHRRLAELVRTFVAPGSGSFAPTPA